MKDKGCFDACSALAVAPAAQSAQALVQTPGGLCFFISFKSLAMLLACVPRAVLMLLEVHCFCEMQLQSGLHRMHSDCD